MHATAAEAIALASELRKLAPLPKKAPKSYMHIATDHCANGKGC